MRFKQIFDKIREVTLKKPYIYSFILIFVAYLFINSIINQAYVTFPVMFGYDLKIIIPFLFLTILIAFLVATNINLVVLKFRELRQINKKEGGLTFTGLFGGLLAGTCPNCFVGLFPAFMGLFGVTASLSILPLYGLEIQIGSAILLIVSLVFLTRNNVCKVK